MGRVDPVDFVNTQSAVAVLVGPSEGFCQLLALLPVTDSLLVEQHDRRHPDRGVHKYVRAFGCRPTILGQCSPRRRAPLEVKVKTAWGYCFLRYNTSPLIFQGSSGMTYPDGLIFQLYCHSLSPVHETVRTFGGKRAVQFGALNGLNLTISNKVELTGPTFVANTFRLRWL